MSEPNPSSHRGILAATRASLDNESLPNDSWRRLKDKVDWPRVRSALRLSRRELELVQHIFDGKKLAAIAKEMKLAIGTVKTYSQRIHHKLDVSDQRELALAVLEAHLAAARPPQ